MDLAAYESAMDKLSADKLFIELSTKTVDIWVPGSMHDEIWQGN